MNIRKRMSHCMSIVHLFIEESPRTTSYENYINTPGSYTRPMVTARGILVFPLQGVLHTSLSSFFIFMSLKAFFDRVEVPYLNHHDDVDSSYINYKDEAMVMNLRLLLLKKKLEDN